MGLQFTLNKENNFLFTDFQNAYWSIDSIAIGNIENNNFVVSGSFNCYPSREAKYKNEDVITQLAFGGSIGAYFNTYLYKHVFQFRVSDVYPDGIPSDYSTLKTQLYEYLKVDLNLINAIDIFED